MTLNQTDSALLKAAIDTQATLYWLHADTTRISGSVYSGIQTDFATWQTEYNNGTLYVTLPNGTTQQLQGIGSWPTPPSR